jgi:hypothetical protein
MEFIIQTSINLFPWGGGYLMMNLGENGFNFFIEDLKNMGVG